MNIHSHLLGDLLVGMGTISHTQLEDALQTQHVCFEDTFQLDLDRTELVSGSRKTRLSRPNWGRFWSKKAIFQMNSCLRP